MDAADVLYGVTMGGDGVTKVVSRRLPREEGSAGEDEDRGRGWRRSPAALRRDRRRRRSEPADLDRPSARLHRLSAAAATFPTTPAEAA